MQLGADYQDLSSFFFFMCLDFSHGWNFLLFAPSKVSIMFNLSEILGEGSTLRQGVNISQSSVGAVQEEVNVCSASAFVSLC